jgi:DNA-directed RNA polymerase subunit RPC12/RpoP
MPDLKQFKCPACGGVLEFTSASQQIKCPYCDSTFSREDFGDLDADLNEAYVEKERDPMIEELYSGEDLKDMSVYTCESCGGEIICGKNTTSTKCPYCDNNVLIKSKISGDLKPKLIIPFKLDKEQSNDSFKSFFKKKFFIPGSFKKENQIEESSSLYVPYFIYSADSDGDVEFEGTKTKRWEDSNYEYKEVSHYRLDRSGLIAFDDIPVDASERMPNDLMESIEPFNKNDHEAFFSGYLAGFQAERYDTEKSTTLKRAHERMVQGTISALQQSTTSYSDVYAKNHNIRFSNETSKYVLYPIWILNVKWKEQKYTFAVNGDTGKVAGKYPISAPKVSMVCALIALAVAGIFFGLGYLFMEGELLYAFIFAAVGLLLGGGISALGITKKLKKRVSLQYGAKNYVRDGSFKLTYSRDTFLYKETSRRAKPKSSK